MADYIKYYPVGNGDMILILLSDNTSILIDCHMRQKAADCTDGSVCDVRKDLHSSLKTRDGIPFLDVFILTHGDKDHCGGYKDNFYRGDPSKYSKEDKENKLIIIDEMWFSPMIAQEHKNPNEEAYQEEAERRLALHQNKNNDKDKPGNRIRIIGYDGTKDYSDLKHLRYIPGNIVDTFNEKKQSIFSLFIHAPFKETLASADVDGKNTNSIVFQARFRKNATSKEFAVLAMFGGDADYIAWELVLEKTIEAGNDAAQSALDWDLFLAPHHCSWTFFNEHDDKDEPKDSSLEVLKYRRPGGLIISSSKKIINNDDNPPSHLAKSTYLKHLDDKTQFLNTDILPTEQSPEPLVFIITANGPAKQENKKNSYAAGSASGAGAAAAITKHG